MITPLPGRSLQRIHHYKAFLHEHYSTLVRMYESLVVTVNPQISLNDWFSFAYNHTRQDGLGLYS